MTWTCPKCKRRFTRKNQRHACGTGSRADVLKNRSPELVLLYSALESFVKSIEARSTPVVSGEDGLRALELAMSINEEIGRRSK